MAGYDLDASWLIAHDARIPLSPAMLTSEIACALDPKIIPDNTGRQTASYFVLGKLPRL